jgi:hypothetical protein
MSSFADNQVVRLTEAVGHNDATYRVGTLCTVVAVVHPGYVVEVSSDTDGSTIAMLDVTADQIRAVGSLFSDASPEEYLDGPFICPEMECGRHIPCRHHPV